MVAKVEEILFSLFFIERLEIVKSKEFSFGAPNGTSQELAAIATIRVLDSI